MRLQFSNCKDQTDVKASLDRDVKSILEQLSNDLYQDKLHKISLMLTTIPEQIQSSLRVIQKKISNTFTREIKAMASLKKPELKVQIPTASSQVMNAKENLPEQRGPVAKSENTLNSKQLQVLKNAQNSLVKAVNISLSPMIQVGSWKKVKSEQRIFKMRASEQCTVVIDIDSDEEDT